MTIDILKLIASQGLRIFDTADLISLSSRIDISVKYVRRALSNMNKKGSINSLGLGLYSLPIELLAGGPLHSFEIGLKIAKKGSISHRSAMHYHNLTDQISNTVYINVPKEEGANLSSHSSYKLNGVTYKLIRIDPKKYWGNKKIFIGEARLSITDLEKTLIDSLSMPQYCGGIREIIFGFEKAVDKISPSQILEYAQKTSVAVCKRLGWILEQVQQFEEIQQVLQNISVKQYQKLDPNNGRSGKYNKRWMIVENI